MSIYNKGQWRLLRLWAKADDFGFHPLLFHLIDVGQCAFALWQNSLSPAMKHEMAHELNLDEKSCANLLSFWAALHDIGKATPVFQAKRPERISALREIGLDFPVMHGASASPHGVASTWSGAKLLEQIGKMNRTDARRVAHALGGHHGIWPNTVTVQNFSASEHGGERWAFAREEIFVKLREIFQPPLGVRLPLDTERKNAILIMLSGLTTAADWLGSMQDYFPYAGASTPIELYVDLSSKRAQQALQQTGWAGGWKPEGQIRSFQEMFPTFQPNEVQQAIIQSGQNLDAPALLILEAPTGVGKTEAALYLADNWLQTQLGRGLYIAMPTRATSNQMFSRTLKFLDSIYPNERINIHLAHSQAFWDEPAQRLKVMSVGESFEEHMRAERWFLPRKRTLLAPFAVGTVDQTLLSVLQARHFFLRLFGLAHKVVIFDEVHAYDTYMEYLFLRLLSWLRAIGTSVIVLSATLPEKTRQSMVNAFSGRQRDLTPGVDYPRLTIASATDVQSIEIPVSESRDIALGWIDREPQSIVSELHNRMNAGGCAAIICNTVGRSQEIYEALLVGGFSAETCTLFHARSPAAWRAMVERKVLNSFGKEGQRPSKAILVATQVVEQSLDLDFDLMISDLAPVDLLIQRVGRLHRHRRATRPSGLVNPVLLLTRPMGSLENPDFGNDAYIYQRFILWQSWRVLEHKSQLSIPSDTTQLIENVYGDYQGTDIPPAMTEELQRAQSEMLQKFQHDGFEAKKRLVPEPKEERLLTDAWQDLQDDENPALHPQLRALTRLINPGVSLICLHRMADGKLNLEPDGSGSWVDLEDMPEKYKIPDLLYYSVSIHHRAVVHHYAEQIPWKSWARSGALRFAFPVIFDKGLCHLPELKLTLALDRTLGFRILKEAP